MRPITRGRLFVALNPATALVVATALVMATAAQLRAQDPDEDVSRITASWTAAPIQEVLRAFAVYSGRSIVAGAGVDDIFVTAEINDQPWDVALGVILETRGLSAVEDEHGIIRVDAMGDLAAREAIQTVVTRTYRISYSRASELQATIAPLLSERGSVSVVESQNTLVVSDIPRVQAVVARLLRRWQPVTAPTTLASSPRRIM